MRKFFLFFALSLSCLWHSSVFALSFGTLVSDEVEANVYPDGVFYDGFSADEDQTLAATSASADDVNLPDKDSIMGDETLYIGSNTVFDEVFFDITTVGDTSRACVVGMECPYYGLEYYDASTSDWEGLSYSDGTNNFETTGVGAWEFDAPETWAQTSVNGQTLFWVRISPSVSTTVTTPASAGEIALHAYNLELTVEDELGTPFEDLVATDFSIDAGDSDENLSLRDRGEGVYQFALDVTAGRSAHTISVRSSGYVNTVLDTGTLSSTQKSMDLTLPFSHKISVVDEDGVGLNPAEVSVEGVACIISGVNAYCPLSISEDSVDANLSVSKVGYISVSTHLSGSRDSSDDAQVETKVELVRDTSVCVAEFDDIGGHWAEDYIDSLYCRGVVSGKDANTFDPSGEATRAEFLKIAVLNAGYDVAGASGADVYFSDVSSGDWFYEYVSFAAERGFVEGYEDGSFHPNEPINRAEALAITMRIANVERYEVDADWEEFEDVAPSDWFAYAVETAANAGIVTGYDEDNTFRPANNITRAEVAAISVRTYDEYYAD